MATFSPEVVVDTAGIIPLGSSLYGQVTAYAEGSTTAVFGWLNSSDVFVPYTDGTISGDGAIVLSCGRNAELAVNVTGVPAKISLRGVRNAPGS